MVLLSMDFYIPGFARKLFLDGKGRIDIGKVEASYEKAVLDELRDYPGLIWKVWAVEENGRHGAGYYLFEDLHSAEVRKRFAEKYYALKGMLFVKCRIRQVLPDCSKATRAPIDLPGNPSMTPEQEYNIMHPALENPMKQLKRKKELIAEYERNKQQESRTRIQDKNPGQE